MSLVDQALSLAIRAHHEQVNKHDGEPYILHPVRVWARVRDNGFDEITQAVALLHDTVEDTSVTYETILDEFPENPEIAGAIMALTKRKGEENREYYLRVKQNPIASAVKLADIHDNFGRTHNITDTATKVRLSSKYSLGIDILERGKTWVNY